MGTEGNYINFDVLCEEEKGIICNHELFKESSEVISMINGFNTIYQDERSVEVSLQRLAVILDQYQEQPHLLDSHLDVMLGKACAVLKDKTMDHMLKKLMFKFLWRVIKVRGYKVVTRHLPHEVADLEPTLQMLENASKDFNDSFECCSVLLLWLSIIVKIPFPLSRLNGSDSGDNTITNRILQQCKIYLHATSAFSVVSAAAYLTSAFLTRIDVLKDHLASFLDWIYTALHFKNDISREEEEKFTGSLVALAAIIKYSKRDDLLTHASTILQYVLKSNFNKSTNTRLKKYGVKVIQRIGVTHLPPKLASWRYQRGSRSLSENLKLEGSVGKTSSNEVQGNDNSNEHIHVPDEVEDVIDELMKGLKDSETVIRWSAAKGIGRVTGRLPQELANEVVSSVLELLSAQESDAAWHGGCLTLAELGRRGLLIPQHLPKVLPVLQKALVFEDPRGYYSVGDHVRDAACYVAWSFARAYDPDILKPSVQTLASSLLAVALFDREVKCRKAAAAAFQENVGRQGTFPHGIDIVTTADYFSVAVRQHAFLKISVFVAGFPEYTFSLIEHLISLKVDQWDAAVRELTASALHKLTPIAPDIMIKYAIPELLKKVRSSDINCRHGAVLALAEIIHGLSIMHYPIDQNIINNIATLTDFYREHEFLNGMGGILLRQACCYLIQKCALSKLPLHDCSVLDSWQILLDECLTNEVSSLREHSATALSIYLSEFYENVEKDKINNLIDKYFAELDSTNQTSRIGVVVAIGKFPKNILLLRLPDFINRLLSTLTITEVSLKWAECRRDTIRALVSVVETVGVIALTGDAHFEWDPTVATNVGAKTRILPSGSAFPVIDAIFDALITCMNEYTNDSRGDVGAWVREAAMTGLKQLLFLVCKHGSIIGDDVLCRIMGLISQQAIERINRTRVLAGRVFIALLFSRDPVLTGIPYREELLELFPESVCTQEINWCSESQTFPKFVELLRFPCYSTYIIQGLIMSIGGMTESLVKHSSESFFDYLRATTTEERERICIAILTVFASNLHDSRVITPLFTFLDKLFGSGVISDIIDKSDFPAEILKLLLELKKAKDFRQLIGKIDVYCQLVQVQGIISRTALAQISVFLCHRLKAVRKATASKLYECLLLYGDVSWVPEDKLDEVMAFVADIDWESDITILRTQRQRLCEMMSVPTPTFINV